MPVVGGAQPEQRKPTFAETMGGMMASRQKPTVNVPNIYPGSSQVPGIGGGSSKQDDSLTESLMRGLERGAENTEWRKRQAILKQDEYERAERNQKMESEQAVITDVISKGSNALNASMNMNLMAADAQVKNAAFLLETLDAAGAPQAEYDKAWQSLQDAMNALQWSPEKVKAVNEQFLKTNEQALATYGNDPRVKALKDSIAAGEGQPLTAEQLGYNARLTNTLNAMSIAFSAARTDAGRRQFVGKIHKSLMQLEMDVAQNDEQKKAIVAQAFGIDPAEAELGEDGSVSATLSQKLTTITGEAMRRAVGVPNETGGEGPFVAKAKAIYARQDLSPWEKQALVFEVGKDFQVQIARELVAGLNTPEFPDVDHGANIEKVIRGNANDLPPSLRSAYGAVASFVGGSILTQMDAQIQPVGSRVGVGAQSMFDSLFSSTSTGAIPNDTRRAAKAMFIAAASAGKQAGQLNDMSYTINKKMTEVLKPFVKSLSDNSPYMSEEELALATDSFSKQLQQIAKGIVQEHPTNNASLSNFFETDGTGMFLPRDQQPAFTGVLKSEVRSPAQEKGSLGMSPAAPNTSTPMDMDQAVMGSAMLGGDEPEGTPMDVDNEATERNFGPDPRLAPEASVDVPSSGRTISPQQGVLEPYSRMQRMPNSTGANRLLEKDYGPAREKMLRDELDLTGILGGNQDVPLPDDYVDPRRANTTGYEQYLKKGFSNTPQAAKKKKAKKGPLKKKAKEGR